MQPLALTASSPSCCVGYVGGGRLNLLGTFPDPLDFDGNSRCVRLGCGPLGILGQCQTLCLVAIVLIRGPVLVPASATFLNCLAAAASAAGRP